MSDYALTVLTWLGDFQLGTFLLLSAACLTMLLCRPGATRIATGWIAGFGIGALAVVCAMPGRPILVRFATSTRPSAVVSEAGVFSGHPVSPYDDEMKKVANSFADISLIDSPTATSVVAEKNEPAGNIAPSVSPINTTTPQKSDSPNIAFWIVTAWFVGIAVQLVWAIIGMRAVRRLLRSAEAVTGQPLDILQRLSADCPTPELMVHEKISHGVATGVMRPVILLPRRMVEQGDSAELRAILSHELSHIRNRDLWLLGLLRALACLAYCQPLFWVMKRLIRDSQELLADRAAAGGCAAEYAERLLGWTRETATLQGSRMIPVVGFFRRSDRLSRRIAALIDSDFRVVAQCGGRSRTMLVVLMATLAVVGSLFTFRPVALEPTKVIAAAPAVVAPKEDKQQDTISGTVLDAKGRPVAGARVVLQESPAGISGSEGLPWSGGYLTKTETDSSGRFSFEQVSDFPLKWKFRARSKRKWFDVFVIAKGLATSWAHVDADESVELRLGSQEEINGRLVGPNDKPVVGAVVRVIQFGRLGDVPRTDYKTDRQPKLSDEQFLSLRGSPRTTLQAKTDEQGKFQIAGVPANRLLTLLADHAKFVQREFYIATTDRPQQDVNYTVWQTQYQEPVHVSPPEIGLEQGREIHVRVVLADTGKPAIGATVDPGPTIGDELLNVDDDGHFVMSQLKTGRHSLRVHAPSGAAYLGSNLYETLNVDSHVVERTIELQRAAIVSGRVVDAISGKGISGVQLYAWRKEMRTGGQIKTSEDGTFQIRTKSGEGNVFVYGIVPGYRVPRSLATPSVLQIDEFSQSYTGVLESPVQGIEIKLQPSPVFTGIVRDPSGNPVSGVTIKTTQHPYLAKSNYPIREWQTDDQGRFSLEELFSNTTYDKEDYYRVALYSLERKLGEVIDIHPPADFNSSPEPLRVDLPAMQTSTGQVVDDKGIPVSGATVRLSGDLIGSPSDRLRTETTTDTDGHFDIDTLIVGADKYNVRATKEGFYRRGSVRADQQTSLKIVIRRKPDPRSTDVPSIKELKPAVAFEVLSHAFPSQERPIADYDQHWKDTLVFSRELLLLAKKYPGTEIALQSCLRIVGANRYAYYESNALALVRREAAQVLLADFIKRRELAQQVEAIIFDDNQINRDVARESIRRLIEKSPHREVVGLATFYWVQWQSRPGVYAMPGGDAIRKENIKLLTKVRDEYGDLPYHSSTLGEQAVTQLRALQNYSVGVKPKNIVGKTLDGKEMKLSDYRGKVVVLWFWAKWSSDPSEPMKKINRLVRYFAGRPFTVLGVAMDNPDKARELIEKHKVPWPSWADGDVDGNRGPISREWDARGHSIYLIDHEGIIRNSDVSIHQLEGRVLPLIDAAENRLN